MNSSPSAAPHSLCRFAIPVASYEKEGKVGTRKEARSTLVEGKETVVRVEDRDWSFSIPKDDSITRNDDGTVSLCVFLRTEVPEEFAESDDRFLIVAFVVEPQHLELSGLPVLLRERWEAIDGDLREFVTGGRIASRPLFRAR